MKALAVCATYGRIPFLGRMLSCFINQTYEDKHLVLINDDKNIDLCCDRKDVTVLNCNNRLLLSEKRNLGIASGYHDIIFPWDDDDVYLPKRMENHIEKYKNPEINCYRNIREYVLYGDEFIADSGSGCFNSVSFRKTEWFRVGGYRHLTPIGEDQELLSKITGLLEEEAPDKSDFVYGWGGMNYHLSCQSDGLEEIAYTQLDNMNLIGKKFWIEPNDEEYNKFVILDRLFRERKTSLKIKHISLGKIDISHLL